MRSASILLACAALSVGVTALADDKPRAVKLPGFDLKSAEMQKLLRAAVGTQREGYRLVSVAPLGETPATRVAAQATFTARPLRQPAAVECREFDCLAFDDKGNVLYTTPPPAARPRIFTGTKADWLSCQSTNNLLPAWERAEVCNR